MPASLVLVASPLVGPLALRPTAEALRRLGADCQLPALSVAEPPPWRDWPKLLAQAVTPVPGAVVVGHSAGGILAAALAARIGARALVCLDAAMPPESGPAPPAADAWFRDFLRTLPLQDGRLPKWHLWWPRDVLAPLPPADRAAFIAALPELPLAWFDDAFPMPDWSRAARHFIRTSKVFDAEADRAESLGWRVIRLDGTHLHPTLCPEETAATLLRIAQGA